MPARKETRLKGRTWKNLWQPINGTSNGVTISTDETGLITVTGKVTDASQSVAVVSTNYVPVKAGSKMTIVRDIEVDGSTLGLNFYNSENKYLEGKNVDTKTEPLTFTVPDGAAYAYCVFWLGAGEPLMTLEEKEALINNVVQHNEEAPTNDAVPLEDGEVTRKFRVMLVEGEEVPDCFTPTGITSAKPTKLVTSNRNLLGAFEKYAQKLPITSNGLTWSDNSDGGLKVDGTASNTSYYNFFDVAGNHYPQLPPGAYTIATGEDKVRGVISFMVNGTLYDKSAAAATTATVKNFRPYLTVSNGTETNTVCYPQLELGSPNTTFEKPEYHETALPKDLELRSLPDGTADVLVIRQDGTAYIERHTAYVESFNDEYSGTNYFSSGDGLNAGDHVVYEVTQTIEWLDSITLPELPATFCEWPESGVPCKESVVYELE